MFRTRSNRLRPREDPLEKEVATYSSILARKIPRTGYRGAWQVIVHGVTKEWIQPSPEQQQTTEI